MPAAARDRHTVRVLSGRGPQPRGQLIWVTLDPSEKIWMFDPSTVVIEVAPPRIELAKW